jgi:protein subunit release factor A
MGSRNQFYK